ncbi:MAG: sulfatase, partial [Anaerolineae bacterium]
GFCNNPLVSVLDNGLKRGFEKFYNYSGTFPDIPDIGDAEPIREARREITQFLQKISGPVERAGSDNPLVLKLAMMPWFVPIWTRLGRFKGDTKRSLQDIADYIRHYSTSGEERPFFMFINMMETHLPYYPPRSISEKWVPYLRKDKEARDFLAKFNVESYRWVAPMIEPFSDKQEKVLRDTYDAEIAYQDRQLRRLFRALKRIGQYDNTMIVVVADHGVSHGEHEFMGHAFVNYNEVAQVPMLVRHPESFPGGRRISQNVSARRVFHTMLHAAGIEHQAYGHTAGELSLHNVLNGHDDSPEDEVVLSEAFPVMNFVNVMEMNNPEAIEYFRVRKLRRTLVEGDHKLHMVGGQSDEFFDIKADPGETNNLLDNPIGYENDIIRMEQTLEEVAHRLESQRDGILAGEQIDYSDNPELLERLRGLGYLE